MILTDLSPPSSLKRAKRKASLSDPKVSSASEIDKWLACSDKWISILEKWETEGNLIKKLYHLSTTGRNKKHDRSPIPSELESILEDEIRPLKFSLFDFSNDLRRMELFPKSAKNKIDVMRIKLHRIGERYDGIKHNMLLNIIEFYPISII